MYFENSPEVKLRYAERLASAVAASSKGADDEEARLDVGEIADYAVHTGPTFARTAAIRVVLGALDAPNSAARQAAYDELVRLVSIGDPDSVAAEAAREVLTAFLSQRAA